MKVMVEFIDYLWATSVHSIFFFVDYFAPSSWIDFKLLNRNHRTTNLHSSWTTEF